MGQQVYDANGVPKLAGTTLVAHAASHQDGGTDEVASGTPGAGVIPKADGTGFLDKGWYPDFVASGASHAKGAVPDPGVTGGTTKYLREDATWAVPPGGSGPHNILSATHIDSAGGGTEAQGDLIARGATTWGRLVLGTPGHFLRAGGTDPAWAKPLWSEIDLTISDLANITTKSHTSLTDIGTNTHVQIDTHIAATAAHGAGAAVVGTTDIQTLTNKTLTAPVITSPQISSTGDMDIDLVDAADTLFEIINSGVGNANLGADGGIFLRGGTINSITLTGTPTSAQVITIPDATATLEITANKNAASGYAGLDGSSKLTGSQQVYGSASNTACEGNDARLSDARTPTAHASTHKNGGGDEVATATAGANEIPKAGAGGTLALGWIPLGSSSMTRPPPQPARAWPS